MEVLLKIKDEKAAHFLEVVKDLSYIKMTKLSPEKAQKIRLTATTKTAKKVKPMSKEKAEIIRHIEQGIKEFNLIRQGKLKAIPLKQVLDEL